MGRGPKIRRRIVRQYYQRFQRVDPATGKVEVGYKRRYVRVVYEVRFPKGLDVSDLVGKEIEFTRRDGEIIIRAH
ncbi:MAG: hypothetical protein QXJ75_05570 [Candidatus Bathyarchaeia archaeon]